MGQKFRFHSDVGEVDLVIPRMGFACSCRRQRLEPTKVHSSVRRTSDDRTDDARSNFFDIPAEGETEPEICACVSRLASTLKPEYASSNAAVRLFRARKALRKRVTESCGTCAEHGCVNGTWHAAMSPLEDQQMATA